MDAANLRIWCKVQAIMANIAAMQAMNAERLSNGMSIAYTEQCFFDKEREIEELTALIQA